MLGGRKGGKNLKLSENREQAGIPKFGDTVNLKQPSQGKPNYRAIAPEGLNY